MVNAKGWLNKFDPRQLDYGFKKAEAYRFNTNSGPSMEVRRFEVYLRE